MSTNSLQAAVNQAYQVFGHYNAPKSPLNVCTSCCMDVEVEAEMRHLPLHQLTAGHFYQYNTGAMADMEQPADEIKYLLPRWLELLEQGQEVHHSVELNLWRAGWCSASSFSREERAVLNQFMLSYFERDLGFDVLLMAHLGGLDVAPLLTHWLDRTDAQSTVCYVKETYWGFWGDQEVRNAFADDQPDFRAAIKQWLLAPANRRTFANKMLEPEFQQLAQQQPDRGAVSFAVMVEAVFDHLTQ